MSTTSDPADRIKELEEERKRLRASNHKLAGDREYWKHRAEQSEYWARWRWSYIHADAAAHIEKLLNKGKGIGYSEVDKAVTKILLNSHRKLKLIGNESLPLKAGGENLFVYIKGLFPDISPTRSLLMIENEDLDEVEQWQNAYDAYAWAAIRLEKEPTSHVANNEKYLESKLRILNRMKQNNQSRSTGMMDKVINWIRYNR